MRWAGYKLGLIWVLHFRNDNQRKLTAAGGEVKLSLEGEESEKECDSRRDADSNEYCVNLIEWWDGAQHDALAASEDSQEDEIRWRFAADRVATGHTKQGF